MERVNVVRVAKDFGLECQTQEGYHAFVHVGSTGQFLARIILTHHSLDFTRG
jgi:hypothetical protein